MARIGGTCYFKIDGQQLSLTGGIEVPMNRTVNDDIIGLDGSVDRKETHRAPYVKGTFKVPKNFPVSKITSSDEMTITAELANGQVYVLSSAWLHGEANHNAEEGTVDLEFHGEEGDYQGLSLYLKNRSSPTKKHCMCWKYVSLRMTRLRRWGSLSLFHLMVV